MRRGDDNPAGGAAPWPRRALVSLWLVALVLLGGALAARWDALISDLAAAPQAERGGLER
jgi:hypothetical protein